MEVLKTILKAALQAKAPCVTVIADAIPTDEQGKALGQQNISKAEFIDLITKFFPNLSTGVHKNKIALKNIGNIFLLTDFSTNKLKLFFPPNEEQKCNEEFEKLSKASASPKLSVTPDPIPIKKVVEKEVKLDPDNLPEDFFVANRKNTPLPGNPAPNPAEVEAAKPQTALQAVQQQAPIYIHAPAPAVKEIVESDEFYYEAEQPGESRSSSGENEIDNLLKLLIKKGGSDLHLTAGVPVCMRVDGDIERIDDTPISFEYMKKLLDPIMPNRNRKEFSKINDTDFAYEIKGVGRFRVNMFRDRNGVGSVMRVIPSKVLTAEQLGLPPAILKFGKLSKGLVVVTGPTGSGKSTTLAALVDWINKNRTDHLLTIEDPIEFVHQQQNCLVNHREIGRHTTSFSRALRAALREDPDIVLIGEMRDLETVAIGIETAETGHLVFGTLHTNTAVSTVDRIVDQFPEGQQAQIRMMLSASLKGVVAQTLLKKKGGGRVAAHEILVVNDAVAAMIRESKTHMIENHMQTQKKDGNLLLNDCLLALVEKGIVDADHALLKSIDKESLMASYRERNIKFETIIKVAS